MSNVISALTARSQFGQMLDEVETQRRSFVIEKRGTPKAILLGLQDYVRLRALRSSPLGFRAPETITLVSRTSLRGNTAAAGSGRFDCTINLGLGEFVGASAFRPFADGF